MGTSITLLEAMLICVVTTLLYAFIKTLIEHFKSK